MAWELSGILKKIIRNASQLEQEKAGFIILHLVSFVTLLSCLIDDRWLLGDEGKQGLWNYCYKNVTAECCGGIDEVLGYKVFIGATRAFLVIESLLYIGIGVHVYFTVYKKEYYQSAACILTFLIGFCSFLSIVIYGARYRDVSGGMTLHVSYAFCGLNFGLQIIICIISVCILNSD